MNGWYPRVNSRGEVASGAGEIFVNEKSFGWGWQPVWIDDDHIVFDAADNEKASHIVNVRSGKVEHIIPQGYNAYAAGGGQWMGLWLGRPQTILHRYSGTSIIETKKDVGPIAMSSDGHYIYTSPYNPHVKTLYLNGKPIWENQQFVDIDVCNTATIATVALGTYPRATYIIPHGGSPRNISILSWESPTLVDTPSGPWVLSVTQQGLMLRKAGETMGYHWIGVFLTPRAYFRDGLFDIVYRREGIELGRFSVNPKDPKVDLTTFVDTDGVNLPKPKPKPIPEPTPTPEPSKEPDMPQAPNKINIVKAVIDAHPEINTLKDGERGQITELVVKELGGLPWGRKDRDQNPNNNNNSDDALCYKVSADSFEIYDILSGSSGKATWSYKGTFKNGENGYFREVNVTTPNPKPIPEPTPDPTPTSCQCDAKLNAIALVLAKVLEVVSQPSDVASDIKAIIAQLDAGFNGQAKLGLNMEFSITPKK